VDLVPTGSPYRDVLRIPSPRPTLTTASGWYLAISISIIRRWLGHRRRVRRRSWRA